MSGCAKQLPEIQTTQRECNAVGDEDEVKAQITQEMIDCIDMGAPQIDNWIRSNE